MESSNQPDTNEPFYSPAQIAARLHVSTNTVIRLIKAGDLLALCINPSNRPGRKCHYRITESWFREFVNQTLMTHRVERVEPPAPSTSRRHGRRPQGPATRCLGAKWFPKR